MVASRRAAVFHLDEDARRLNIGFTLPSGYGVHMTLQFSVLPIRVGLELAL